MAKVADKFPVSFIVSTGDNFYAPKGKENPNAAPPIRDLFESVYTNSSLKKLPWYLTLGNHDHDDYDYKQEIAYTTNRNNRGQRWILPGNYYSVTNSQASALLVFLDTTPIVSPATNVFLHPEAQLTWLRNTLAVSTNQWKLVFGHHPIVYMDEPGGPVGCRPVAGDLQSAEKILLEQRVMAYFCGHIHSLEYLLDSRQGQQLHCFISAGGGSGISHVSCPKTDDNNWSFWDHGFVHVSIHPEKMVVTFWNSAGNNFATVVVKK